MTSIQKRLSLILCVFMVFGSVFLAGQEKPAPRPFTIDDYGRWQSLTSTSISDDGTWMTFGYSKEKSDDLFYAQSLTSDKKYEIPRGSRPLFSDNSKWLITIVSLPWKEAEKLRDEKKPVPDKAQLMNLQTGDSITWNDVASFHFSKGSQFLAVKKTKSDPKAKFTGTDLILRDLSRGTDLNLGNVDSFSFNKPGTHFAYTIDASDKAGNGLYLIKLSTSAIQTLDNGNADYAHLIWDEKGTGLAVLKGTQSEEFTQKDNILIAYIGLNGDHPTRIEYDPSQDTSFPESMVISEKTGSSSRSRGGQSARGPLFWSEDNTMIFLGIKGQEKVPEKKKDDDNPVADVDIWHWNDEVLQSVQMKRAASDRNFTFRSVYHWKDKKFFQLTDEKMRTISISENARWGIGRDDKAYISDWQETQADYYRVNTRTNERTLMFKGQKQVLGLSPDSRHYLFWKDGHIWDYVIESGKIVNLTQNAPVSFVNEDYDHPDTKPPYGITGWTKDGKSVVLTHKYDLWLQPLDGSIPSDITLGKGTKDEIRFRYVQTDSEEKFIDFSKPVILSAYGEWTKKAGFYTLKKGKLEKNVYEDKAYGRLTKAKNADRFMYTIETPRDFPNYYISDQTFLNPRQLTDANPWQPEYKWGYNILIEYANKGGKRLQGVLSIPDDYQQGQKLPMLVDFYEKNSQNLNRFSRMIYRDTPMFYKYVSNGYLVLLPDVHFNTRTTHSDMLDCVEAAVKKVIEMGYADPQRVGLHGHSFSGQGAALIAGRSKMFAAIVAGAAATDLVADFNQLWKSSGTNQHSYDYYGQGRFGTNPFDDLELYINESAVFHARTMDTPLLLLHGTDDGSVEWLQAVEFYNALRFNGKNVILLSYPGQDHHATKLENKIDFQIRMEQFYDHYLKGKPAPDWMVKGIPFINKKK
ncbi:MAG: prolyl oligopeptidase family serine peptidase [Candidatus Aminicenantes bacterium]|nr:prolyl oligopeptidase family serine peptidase [Candidatus Aminicenantes bacterium]